MIICVHIHTHARTYAHTRYVPAHKFADGQVTEILIAIKPVRPVWFDIIHCVDHASIMRRSCVSHTIPNTNDVWRFHSIPTFRRLSYKYVT